MKIFTSRTIWIVIFFCLSGCQRYIPGGPAAAPTNVVVTAGDSSAVITWDMLPGVEYLAFWDLGSVISIASCASSPTCTASGGYITSPYVISGLFNGTPYSVTINGRTEGAKGGPGSPSISFTPILAGPSNTWTLGNTLGYGNLLGVTFGNIWDNSSFLYVNEYISTGANNALFSSYDGITWNSLNWNPLYSPAPNTTFYGITNFGTTFIGVGQGGAILYSYFDGVNPLTWNYAPSSTTNNLYAVFNTGAFVIAVGQSGTIITTSSIGFPTGPTWNPPEPPPTQYDLKSIILGYGFYVAVGSHGTLLTSGDAINWQANTTIPSSVNFTSVAFGMVTSTLTGLQTPTFVAVGSGGQIYTNTDFIGVTWSPISLPSPQSNDTTPQLTAVTFGSRTSSIPSNSIAVAATSQFIAVDDKGNVFTSFDGLSWAPQPLTITGGQPLYSITSGLSDYTAVGAGGLNIHSY